MPTCIGGAQRVGAVNPCCCCCWHKKSGKGEEVWTKNRNSAVTTHFPLVLSMKVGGGSGLLKHGL